MNGLALGLAATAAGLIGLDCGDLVLLTAPRDSTASERLCLCLAAMERLPAFLPFAPRTAPGAARARVWADGNRNAIHAALATLAGRAEMIVTLEAPEPSGAAPPPAESGRDWLRARAAREARARALGTLLVRLLPEGPPRLIAPAAITRAEAVLLVPPPEMAGMARGLAAAAPPGMVLRCSGPWPAFGHAAAVLPPAGIAA